MIVYPQVGQSGLVETKEMCWPAALYVLTFVAPPGAKVRLIIRLSPSNKKVAVVPPPKSAVDKLPSAPYTKVVVSSGNPLEVEIVEMTRFLSSYCKVSV